MIEHTEQAADVSSLMEDVYPLSPIQLGIVFHVLFSPDSGAYLNQYVFSLRGNPDPVVLREAWQHVLDQRPVLRTAFVWEEVEHAVQVVFRRAVLPWESCDWRGHPAEEQQERLNLHLESQRRPFDLLRPPLMRVSLIRRAEEEFDLVWSFHHLVLDGWSLSLVLQDVLTSYDALLRRTVPVLPRRRPYHDYIAWLLRQELPAAEAYWRGVLEGFTTPTPLGVDRKPGTASDGRRAHGNALRQLSPSATGALQVVAKQHRLTPNTMVQGAWALLLSRYSGEDDVVFGAVVTGRPPQLAGMEAMIGLFINTLPVRVRVDGGARLDGWLRELQEQQMAARSYDHSPLSEVQRWSGVAAGQPLFESIVAFENHPVEAVAGTGERSFVVEHWERVGRSHYPLELMVLPGERLGLQVEYDEVRIEAAAAAQMVGRLEVLLEAMAADPMRRLGQVSLLRGAERIQVLEAWNATAVPLPQACIHELFTDQAARTPGAVAVVSQGEVLSYAELEHRSSRLAHLLRRRGIGPETRAGVCMERGVEVVVALLGVLKAGGAYVPLDPSNPVERLREVFADAGVALVLTHAAAGAQLPGEVEALWLDEPETAAALDAMPQTPPSVASHPGQLAYVIYTSGSTGRPKGVAVAHASVVRLVHNTRYVPFGPQERIAQVSNLAFDAATFEIWGALLGGGSLVVIEREATLSPSVFAAELRGRGVSAVFVTTALFNRIAHDEPGAFGSLRHVLFGGELVDPQSVRRVLERGAPERLLHVYGPTETTTYASWQLVRAVEPGASTVPIGVPLGNTALYVLDASGEAVPPGVPGELYVGGVGVARGYLGQPAQTAERFVPDAFGALGSRLYRTGDRVRWNGRGEVEYLGRLDTQVKIRGFRIEPGEVEAVLLEQEGVREAVVAVREDVPGNPRLVAYVVPEEDARLTPGELRAQLGMRLPEYMVPGAYVVLERLPLNANGKVDRRSLPMPEQGSAAAYVAPRTAAEEVLAGIWAEVLGVERVGVEANFFELGGHSLLATQVVSRARQAFGVEVPLRVLFEAPSVAALAGRIEALRSAGTSSALPIERVSREGPLPLSFAQQRLWVVDRLEPGSVAYNMPYALRLRGVLDLRALRGSIGGLVRRHEAMRTTFAEHEGVPVQVIHPAAPVPLPVLDLGGLSGEARQHLAQRLAGLEAMRPFDLSRGPLLRSTLLRLSGEDHVLCFTLHHVVSDGWSMDVLVREVSLLYAALSRGETPRLPELPVQYADYAAWQRAWLSGEVLEEQLGYWRDRMAGAPPLLEIPTDRPRAAGQRAEAGSQRFALPAGLSDELRALSRAEGGTLFMTVLAGWQALLGRWAGQEDVVVGSPIAGRNRRETEGLIGFFVNMLALRGDLSGDPTWTELVGRVAETALGAYEHQELPFERLVEELAIERSLTHTPLFQAIFAMNRSSGPDERLELGGLSVELFGREGEGVARFDLDLVVADSGGALSGALVYRKALFEVESIERMVGHLEVVLGAMAADPRRHLSQVSLLRGAERAQVLEAWNATAAEFPRGCIHELFAEQAARTPDAAAVLFGDEVLTYAELERRSNQLGHLLRRHGVVPEVRVGLCVERSPEMVVGVLGILKAGGAYLPLDPSSPAGRLSHMLSDAGAGVLLAGDVFPDGLPAFEGEILRLDAQCQSIAGEPVDALPVEVGARNAAYVIYTSGSTGTPKGVVVEHENLANYLQYFDAAILGEAGFALPLVSRLSFDAHVRQLFPPLLRGGAVWVLPETAATDAGALLEALGARERVGFGGVPSLWGAVLERMERGEGAVPRGLVAVLLGGEAIRGELVRRTRRLFPDVAIWNHYGPTEATVNTTAGRVREAGGITLGRPIANVRVYVLDGWGEPVPAGVPGELYAGGAGVSRGYLGRPERTAETYLPDPFSREAGARLYRSGDRVRWRGDGELEYLGRVDQQVKIRGFRIELGEIEIALTGHPGVSRAVVTVREDVPGNRRLVAYVVGEAGVEVPAAELRAHLGARLPDYMVPGAYVVLERLPLNASGKVDRRALPAPEQGSAVAYVAPRTAAEEVLAGIWAEALGVERVGVEANFFELGGHSLLATQVVSRARQAFGVEVPLRALFEAPSVAALAGRIEALRSAGTSSAPPIERVSREGPLPLSFAQQRLWVVDRQEPGSVAYNMPYALRLRGALDVRALRGSIGGLVRRHEALRTTFAEHEGVPVQVIHPATPVPLPVLDLGALREGEREGVAKRLAGTEAMRPFDLSRGPLLRSTLLRLSGEDHVLCFTLHHVVSDGWSMDVLVREVSLLYAALSRGEAPRLPELPVQYADYAAWQRAWLSGEALEEQLAFWREQLRSAPPLLEVPTDRPRTPGQSPRAESRRFALPAEVSQGLRALSRAEGATLFMTVLAAWQALLSKYSGQEDVVVGSPIAGRNRREAEGLIGFFVNILVLRGDLAGDPTWAELVGRVRETALGAYEHQELPFEKLVEEVSVERSFTHTPLFQVTFSLDQSGGRDGRLELGGLAVEPFGGGRDGVARFDLELVIADSGEALGGVLAYRASLFEAETMARMAGHLKILLEAMAADPARRISEASLLRGAERARVLEAWNAVAADYPPLGVHQLFTEQAARTPDAAAIRFEERSLTYAELERSANRLAHHLRAHGVGPEARVGLCVERTPEMVVAMLGILKAGGAYVPLDPAYPAGRLEYMLEDAGIALVVAQAHLAERLPAGVPRVLLDTEAGLIAARPGSAPPGAAEPGNLAYVLYTSGSTGRPKGVEVTHRGLSNYLGWAADAYAGRGHGAPVHSSLSFDLTVTSLLVPLLRGERVVLSGEAGGVEGLARALREEPGFTLVKLTPAHLALLAEQLSEAEAAAAARTLVVGGESLPAELAAYWRRVAPGTELVNEYGPTETVVGCVVHRVREGSGGGGSVPIGRPIAGTRVYVLDGAGEPVPVGVPGELYVGGAGVARGYRGQPGLTAEKFVPDAFGGESGARLYRTGDRARWLAGGELEYLGRTDEQVKVRGYRIEPGEVESALAALPEVREAVVTVREDAPGDRRLVAYVVAEEGADVAAAGLRAHLAGRLPEHMVPAAFVALERLPLTANGKVDRRALPAPRWGAEDAYVAPRTPAEEVLGAIWAEVLGVERVGTGESFFELGGHSLLATQVVSRARQAFGTEVPLRALFEAPTVAALAERIRDLRGSGAAAPPSMERVPRDAPLPLSFAQQRLWLVDRLEPGSAAYNMPYALRLRGAFGVPALGAGLDALVERHETLRTVFAERGGAPVQVIRPPAPVPLPVLDLRALPEAEREAEARRLADEEALRPFDLEAGPLLRSTLLRLDDDDHVLCFTLHHVVGDGWSMEVLVREVSALYAGEPLPGLPVQYADYAVWQRAWLGGGALEAQLAWWCERLAGAPPLLEVPTDRPRAPGQSPRAGRHRFTLSPGAAQGLRELSRREGATLFMTTLAAWQVLLARYAGQEDVVVGTPIAGRTRRETEGLIGFFVNLLALRADLSGDPTWTELLGRTRATALGAFDHQELPFERLVEELGAERSLTHTPVFQVTFALQRSGAEGQLSLGDLELAPFGSGAGVAKFDLGLALADEPESLAGTLAYKGALFEAETIARMAGHLEVLLEAMAAEPRQRLSELSLLRDGERAQLMAGSRAEAVRHPSACVHELFSAQAAATPDLTAVAGRGGALTYTELERGANRLARHLQRRGVGPESRVGVCLEPGAELVVGVLAILKAGGAYVPLDPAYPAERLAYTLSDSGASVLLTRSALLDSLPAFAGEVVRLDADEEAVSREPDGAPRSGVDARNAAYVVYTSGSTGRPKGVVVEHAGLANTLLGTLEAFGPGAGEVFPATASYAFDIWAFEVFSPLLSGGTVRLLARETVRDVERLVGELAEVDAVHAVPALMREVVQRVQAGPGTLPRMRRVYVGGDAVPPDLIGEMRRAFPSAELRVLYGPTEATILGAASRLRAEGGYAWQVVGRPLPGAGLYVCDAGGSLLPAGVPGELWIGGAGVARGYLGRPELTAEKFVPDAFASEPGARLYRTGDRVRQRADGELEFLGRTDQQVKVRGFRIEPGEVEAALLAHEAVREAAVAVREDVPGQKRLVAYVAAEERSGAELWPSIGEYFVYDELIYRGLTQDALRNARYLRALERVAPGRVVLDVGTGMDAVLARLAVQAGARHVYAVEILERSYLAARERIRELGLEDRITLVHGDARTVELPEPADVCVTEIVEAVAGGEGAAAILNGVRRLLAPGAVMIPGLTRTLVAAVTLPEEIRREPAFPPTAAHYVRKIFDEVGHPFDLRLCIRSFPAQNRLSDAGVFEELDFGAGEVAPEYRRTEELEIRRAGRLDGLLLWLRMELAGGETLDVLEEETAWFPVYFPLFEPGVKVRPGDRLRLECRAELPDGGVAPDYAVRGALVRGGAEEAVPFEFVSPHHAPRYRDSPFYRRLFESGEVPVRGRTERELAGELRAYLAARLPEHMVPAAYVALERLPLTPNGKVDRRALPAPGPGAEKEYVAPRTEMEELLCEVWLDVLGAGGEARRARVGVHDDFFGMGGHSLLAIQVVTRVRQELGIEVPLGILIESPTVAAFAEALEELLFLEMDDAEMEARLSRLELAGTFEAGE